MTLAEKLHTLLYSRPALATVRQTCKAINDIAYAVHGSTNAEEQELAAIIRARIPLLALHIASAAAQQPHTHLHSALYIARQAEAQLRATQEYLSAPPEPQLLIGATDMAGCDFIERHITKEATIERFSYIPYLLVRASKQVLSELLCNTSFRTDMHTPARYSVTPYKCAFHSDTWNIELVHAEQAWNKSNGNGSSVAVIDTGIDYNHQALRERFGTLKGVSFVRGTSMEDDNGHGTHVAGTIAGRDVGVAPGATLYAVKVLDKHGSGSEVAVLKGIEWAIERNVDVINMSLGSTSSSRAEAQLVAVAAQRGIAVCCAAGNDGNSAYNYPASYPGAISSAAIDRECRHADFSNHNDAVDLAAPGVSIYSTSAGGGYEVLSGTSMATPHIAGGCALLKALSVREPEAVLKATAQQLGSAHYFGSGLINLAHAVSNTAAHRHAEAQYERVHHRIQTDRAAAHIQRTQRIPSRDPTFTQGRVFHYSG